MSSVTNIIVSCSVLDVSRVHKQLNTYTKIVETADFKMINNYEVGGDKNLEASLFAAAFNYMNYSKFIECMKQLRTILELPYRSYDEVQIFVKRQEDETWTVFTIDDINENFFRYQ